MKLRSLLVAIVIGLGWMLALPCAAGACSCAYAEPKTRVEQSDAAFIGVLLDRRPADPSADADSPDGQLIFRFRVERVMKGALPPEVDVYSANNGAACGFELQNGERSGVLLYSGDGRWTGGLCGQMTEAEMESVGEGHPPDPNATNPSPTPRSHPVEEPHKEPPSPMETVVPTPVTPEETVEPVSFSEEKRFDDIGESNTLMIALLTGSFGATVAGGITLVLKRRKAKG